MFFATASACLFLAAHQSTSRPPELRLPERDTMALGGTKLATLLAPMGLESREDRIFQEIMSGNVPTWLRKFVPVDVSAPNVKAKGTIFVCPDYLAVGSDDDYMFVPMTPYTAQRLADRLQCILPTPQMVDAIYKSATVKLPPAPIPPSPAMTTIPVFAKHTETIANQRKTTPGAFGTLVAGDKKDIVISRALADNPGHVAIYGWTQPDGKPIQPLYLGHLATWADYSHGVRLVFDRMTIDGESRGIDDVLKDPQLAPLLSDEGPIAQPRYVFHHFPREESWIRTPPGERVESFAPVPGVRALVDTPVKRGERTEVVIYALPNGNSIEQTFGHKKDPDDDFRYDIQQIGAQTRYLRSVLTDRSVIVVYLEASGHAWPAWLHDKDPQIAKQIIDAVKQRFPEKDVGFTLDSHSGGGALTFAYIRAVDQIPTWIDRIAFVDSEYNYETEVHAAKLTEWLRFPGHYLCAIAYDDAAARYQGKPVVTPQGGTWGRSHAMLDDLGKAFAIKRVGDTDPERYVGLDGRVVFLLKQNPHGEIFHTVQVERNGFIESLLSGTPLEGQGYHYFGPRAYSKYIGE